MKLEIKDIIDKRKDKKCLVIGHGKSLNLYLDKLESLKNKGYILIGCNNWSEFYPNVSPHYWVNANTVDNVTNQIELINKYKPIWVYADSVDLKDKEWIEKNIQTDYLPYDQRHFNGKKCKVCDSFGCKKNLSNRLTIQEELQKYTGYNKHYSTGDTVILHSLAFSIIMGCIDIYLLGVDLNYRVGYAKNNTGRKPPEKSYFDNNRYGSNIINDMNIISNSAKLKNVNIYNTNLTSEWNVFKLRDLNGL